MKDLLEKIDEKEYFNEMLRDLECLYSIKREWVLKVMYFESRIDPNAKNKISGAYGLIQFMPETVKNLNYPQEAVKNQILQIGMVQNYFSRFKNRIKNFHDCYFAVFFPLAIGKPEDFVFQTKRLLASKIARQNKAFDTNGDQEITRKEVCDYLDKFFAKPAHNHNFNIL